MFFVQEKLLVHDRAGNITKRNTWETPVCGHYKQGGYPGSMISKYFKYAPHLGGSGLQ